MTLSDGPKIDGKRHREKKCREQKKGRFPCTRAQSAEPPAVNCREAAGDPGKHEEERRVNPKLSYQISFRVVLQVSYLRHRNPERRFTHAKMPAENRNPRKKNQPTADDRITRSFGTKPTEAAAKNGRTKDCPAIERCNVTC